MITFSDREGRLDVLPVDCDRCSRHGRYPVAKLIKDHGGDAKLGEWFKATGGPCRCGAAPIKASGVSIE